MSSTQYVVLTTTDSPAPGDPPKTIEAQAEGLAQEIIKKYQELRPGERPDTEHDRIVLTAGVVIDD